jgi:hypothetical protein
MASSRADKQQQGSDKPTSPEPVGRRPWIRVDRARITRSDEKERPYRIRIEGHNLLGSIVQPIISVGGLPLENTRFVDGGKAIEGTLSREPKDLQVVVDYDVTRAEIEATWEKESSDRTAS